MGNKLRTVIFLFGIGFVLSLVTVFVYSGIALIIIALLYPQKKKPSDTFGYEIHIKNNKIISITPIDKKDVQP